MPRSYSCCHCGLESLARSPASSPSSMDLQRLQMKVANPGTWQDLPTSSILKRSKATQVRLWPAMPASCSSCWCSAFMSSRTCRAVGTAWRMAIMRMMFSVSSCSGSWHVVLGRMKKAEALRALSRSRSASSSTLARKTWTCRAARCMDFCLRWAVMAWMVSVDAGLELGKAKMACRSSASSAWSGWKSSAMKSLTIVTVGLPVMTMCLLRPLDVS
mmetsp:Transcript_44272/g.141051  ORF Transcript_44272/g.141051 Transcript_44272/m.141051 type:complete len:216 (+) Transcript_44272:248-895(+)